MRKGNLKIVNDPIYGFITIPSERIFRIIEHPYFQRLRRIRQLGMTHLVYPGAHHTRFQHALGAMHLMSEAVDILRSKGHDITTDESEAVMIAILLHDIGHGPFSHALEDSIVPGMRHEEISELFMDSLNREFDGELSLAIRIFRNQYSKKFLHQLVSSQLDMDRLDYLNRDSFFTGVSEGVISQDRIIKMLEVYNDELAIEEKGIYSIEKFIVARRLMYWQVYLHKTVLGAECILINTLRRAKELVKRGEKIFSTPTLEKFLQRDYSMKDFAVDPGLLENFAGLDDSDITASVKIWSKHPDPIISFLSLALLNRRLFRILIERHPFETGFIEQIQAEVRHKYSLRESDVNYFVISGKIVNNAYTTRNDKINILRKDGSVMDIADAADTLNIKSLSEPVEKFYLCFPK